MPRRGSRGSRKTPVKRKKAHLAASFTRWAKRQSAARGRRMGGAIIGAGRRRGRRPTLKKRKVLRYGYAKRTGKRYQMPK